MDRRKRTARHTRKKKGGSLWTPNKNRSVKRRENLLTYTSNSTRKSNAARQAVHNYLEALQKEQNSEENITRDDVLAVITPKQMVSLINYRDYVKRRCRELIDTKVKVLLSQEKDIHQKYRLSKQTTFLANRAAIRAQQAAHVSAIDRLSQSSVAAAIQDELDAWNKSAEQRKLSDKENIKEAQLIIQNKSTLQTKELFLRYELTKQVAEHIKGLDYIIPLYESRNNRTTVQQIIKDARDVILLKIPAFNGKDAMTVDRIIPMITEEIYGMVLATLQDYIVNGALKESNALKARLQFFIIQEKQMRLARQHFEILVAAYPPLRKELGGNVLLNEPLYKQTLAEIKNIREKIKNRDGAQNH
jgi:hypothetical protein